MINSSNIIYDEGHGIENAENMPILHSNNAEFLKFGPLRLTTTHNLPIHNSMHITTSRSAYITPSPSTGAQQTIHQQKGIPQLNPATHRALSHPPTPRSCHPL